MTWKAVGPDISFITRGHRTSPRDRGSKQKLLAATTILLQLKEGQRKVRGAFHAKGAGEKHFVMRGRAIMRCHRKT